MLQQTQVSTVVPYYEKFLKRFPTVMTLAEAPVDEVLRLWAGLGYYARARHLHRAAKAVAEKYGGRFPDTVDGLRCLPGVGDYTAGAIASIAFGRRAAIVDGNVARVLARLFAIEDDVRAGPGRERAWRVAEALTPIKRCGAFNEALMELGATVCLPRDTPRCEACPLAGECRAFGTARVAELPAAARRAEIRPETHVVAALARGNRWLALRRPEGGLWGGLWELPTAVANGTPPIRAAIALAASLLGRPPGTMTPFGKVTQQLTHRLVTFAGYCAKLDATAAVQRSDAEAGSATSDSRARWVTLAELQSLGVSTAMRRVIAALEKTCNASTGRSAGRRTQ